MRVIIRNRRHGAVFVHPIDPAPRTAILARGFRETKLTRIFPQGWSEQAARFAPASVAGPREHVFQAARAGVRVEHSVVLFTHPGEPGLTSLERESLWEAFEVPVFEQYLGPNSELLATECDAHSGLHVVNGYEDLDLEYDACACGNRAPRLVRGARIDELAALLS
ncbi:MAG TPA: hypothetical protein VME17_05560 [Bryobacteraceae bacterium]|nr:hypothetical protein [Bryobacteraceae bacterium]